ncbi:MAG: MATE family efflux transporter [Clostridia bacterium]|nr:MATE family efflux transporter [Clostridia bacterium]
MTRTATGQNDFSKGPVWKNIIRQALPLTIAQFVHLLYNVMDRVYIGHMEGVGTLALTGVGLTFPVVTVILAFAALFGMGGVPLFSIERGAENKEKAARIMGNSFALIVIAAAALTVLLYIFRRPVLFAFGASGDSFVYADEYLRIYLAGTLFSMLATGMNGYINAQGFPRTGMLSIIIGAGVNIALDPLFIFALRMGVSGAAIASVISQAVSAAWVLRFLTGKRAEIPLSPKSIRIDGATVAAISKLGAANFIMQGTNFLVQVVCNSTLQGYGGDIYVGIMTVTNSIRDVFMLPISGIVGGAMPVIGFNYGAKNYARVRDGIRFNTIVGAVYTMAAWLLVVTLPRVWFGVFSDDAALLDAGVGMLRIYFFGFVFMALQFAGQSAFQSLGDARHAIFFSLLRKAVIVVPLTVVLPMIGFGVTGVFLAEPISNVAGGLACYITMRMTVYKKIESLIPKNEKE